MGKFRFVLGSSVVVLALLASASVCAKDVYVKAGATGNGEKGSPYGELWKAIDRAERGDVIHVTKGVYNAKGGCGCFTPKIPSLTLVGGYDENFANRNPFKNLTVLERAKDYRGDTMGLGEGIIDGKAGTDHSNLTVDGFVLNSASRNAYDSSGKLIPKGSWKGALFKASGTNTIVRNCILLNPYGKGVYCVWQGEKNEISNSFLVNTFYCAMSTRSAQPDSVVTVKNCTVCFSWFRPGMGGAIGVFVGNKGKTLIENNILAFFQTEGGEAGYGVLNGFGNDETVLKNNIFFQNQGGFYKYLDEDSKNLVIWKPEGLADLNEECEDYMLDEAEGNSNKNPQLQPDKDYFEKFSNFVASKPGKLNMDTMNQWRRSLGLPLQADPGSPRKNWGMEYPLDKVVPNLISKVSGIGVQVNGPFQSYKSAPAAATAANYAPVDFAVFKKGSAELKGMSGKPVQFKANMGGNKMSWLLEKAPRSDYTCVMLILPGKKEPTRDYLYGYLLNGSEAFKKWMKYAKKKDRYNKKGGLVIKGRAFYLGKDAYNFPAGVIIDEVSKK